MQKMKIYLLPLGLLILIFSGCKKKWESDMPTVEAFIIERMPKDSKYTHKISYTFMYSEEFKTLKNYPPMIWNSVGSPKNYLLSRLEAKGKSKTRSHQDGGVIKTEGLYDLTGLLSSEHKNYIMIRASGDNDKIKAVSIPILE